MSTEERTPQERSLQSVSETAHWLEQSHQQLSVRVNRLQQNVDQVSNVFRDHGEQLRTLERSAASITSLLARLARVEEDVRQTQENISRWQQEQSARAEMEAQAERSRQADDDRHRREHTEVVHQVAELNRDDESLKGRLLLVEEGTRRHQEEIDQNRNRLDDRERQNETVQAELTRQAESVRRNDLETSRVTGELDAVKRQVEGLLGRYQILSDQVRRLDTLHTALVAEEEQRRNLTERFDLQRVEVQRLTKLVTDLQEAHGSLVQQLEERTRQVAHLELRQQNTADLIKQVQSELNEFNQRVTEEMNGQARREEQQKRRAIAELEQQIVELRQRTVNAGGGSRDGT